MSDFKTIAALSELEDGEGKCVTVDDKKIALVRVGDEVFALNNICPHQGAPLAEGWVEEDAIICPLHGWEFDLRTGATTNGTTPATTFEVRIEDDQVQVAIE